MNKKVSFLFAIVITSLLASCSGAYDNNNASNANGSAISNNLVSPTNSTYNWSIGSAEMGCNINGVPWTSNNTNTSYAFDSSTNYYSQITGYSAPYYVIVSLITAYGGQNYPMGYHNYNTQGKVADSAGLLDNGYAYWSYNGNSGGVKIIENDSAWVKGLFYFQGVDSLYQVINISNGYFNIPKI